jgi:hypothetical protein
MERNPETKDYVAVYRVDGEEAARMEFYALNDDRALGFAKGWGVCYFDCGYSTPDKFAFEVFRRPAGELVKDGVIYRDFLNRQPPEDHPPKT